MIPTTTDPIFVLLAGGQSVRMGEDKGFVPIGPDSHFLSHILKTLNKFSTSLYVSLRKEQVDSYSKYIQKPSLILDKELTVEGPLKGILSSYIYLKDNNLLNDFIFVLPIDIPFIEEKTIQRLLDTIKGRSRSIPGIFYESNTGLEPLCGIYTTQTLSQWMASLSIPGKQEFSLQKRIKILEPKPLFIKLPDEEESSFRNINSKNDL
ncbi:molybdenum cofactor guanylyltransferase [Leptospira vanthielii]|uniref:MobA-like NTP transferase domain protein n=1 Tax=Leptospira vanthielii serovar Holland str. Waz Holland = ATCC 700522 TaxID=1218591 RepID=N1WD52_9LEPT|nr:molybdenum cofactor guanylyltransferase [Leptospira vanthielii]EMY71122.1 MobA-like NTP transferase domain protein [Leptospira vanthielii serovar Holland str. Waz Holland = ATCC 700522]